MRIGLDFDNTIVSYDALFHKVAVEQGHVPESVARRKVAVRDRLRAEGKEAVWIELQGQVYGARMMEAEPFPQAIEFLREAEQYDIEATIVSHKTRHPFSGPAYDLHRAAREWIAARLVDDGKPVLPEGRIFFELSRDRKLGRIAAGKFDMFVDNLPEILTHPAFPDNTLPVLFDPTGREAVPAHVKRVESWAALAELARNPSCAAT